MPGTDDQARELIEAQRHVMREEPDGDFVSERLNSIANRSGSF